MTITAIGARLAMVGVIVVVNGCLGGSSTTDQPATRSDTTSAPIAEQSTTTTAPTGTSAVVAPAPLTHRQFVKQLDKICRKANRQADRRFGAAQEAAVAAGDYDALADVHKSARAFNKPFYRKVRLLAKRGISERDERGLKKYLDLSHQIDVYEVRLIAALRERDLEEITRLNTLEEQARNQRTRVTAGMGLNECGS